MVIDTLGSQGLRIWRYKTMSNLTIQDIQSIHAEVSQEDLEYIKETYGSVGKGLKMAVKDGPLEKAIGMINKLIEENNELELKTKKRNTIMKNKIAEIEMLIDSYKDELQLIKKSIKISMWNTTLEETKIETIERVIEDLENIIN